MPGDKVNLGFTTPEHMTSRQLAIGSVIFYQDFSLRAFAGRAILTQAATPIQVLDLYRSLYAARVPWRLYNMAFVGMYQADPRPN